MFYLDLFRALNDHQVRYLLVGGLAMNLHGVPRMTMDVDLVLAMDEDNLDRFIGCARALDLSPVAPVPLAALKDAEQRRQWAEQKHMIAFALQPASTGGPTVDILIRPVIDIAAALLRGEARHLKDVAVSVAAIEDMITLKSAAGRQQDEDDIAHLERLRGPG
jgi:hypothetical protein